MAKPRVEARECAALLTAIVAKKGVRTSAIKALFDWVNKKPDQFLYRMTFVARLVVEPRFASALADVAPPCIRELSYWGTASWRAGFGITPAMYATLTAEFDPDELLLIEIGSNQDEVCAHGKAELKAALAKPKQAGALALRLLTRAAKLPSGIRARENVIALCLPVLLKTLGARKPLPEELDELVQLFLPDAKLMLAALEKIPLARRAARFQDAVDRGRLQRITPAQLRLASKPTVAVIERLLAVAKVEEATKAKAAKQETTAKGNGPFSFVDPVRVLPSDYAALDAVGQAQYRAAAGAYVASGTVKDPKDFIRQLQKEELDEGDAELRRWRVMRGKQHVFDLWVVWVENASFFEAGTSTRAPAQVIQGSYLPMGRDQAAKQLATELGNSERKSLWALS